MQMDAMEHGKSLYFNDDDSQMFMNVLQMKGPYIMHKFRTSKLVNLEVDPLIISPNITFDNDNSQQIKMHLEEYSQVLVDVQKFTINRHILYLTVIMIGDSYL